MPAKGHKTKFVNIKAKDCEAPLLPGRQKCECQAVKHPLINNCLSCGRIVCIQEGSGPCFFCGEIVLSKEERAKVQTGNTKEAQNLMSKYNRLPKPQEEEKKREAQAQKEKLLEYDKNSVRRTKVIDDQADYFAVENPWLSEEEKAVLKDRKQAYIDAKNRLKRKVKVTIDFAGRRVIEEADQVGLEEFNFLNVSGAPRKVEAKPPDPSEDTYPKLIEPEFVGELEKTSKEKPVLWSNRIQDSQLQEMVDAGHCLSVCQPYASMIMEGIKLFEGRTWYTSVRGRLWIHASSKPPTKDLLDQVKAVYTHIVGDLEFPETFPLGCLLGYVDLLECIPQEEYNQLYPLGEVSDPYVFVLANPQILPFRLPMKGQLKIYKLEQHIHQAAKRALDQKN